MPRTIAFNMYLDKTRTDGGLASTSWWLWDPIGNQWGKMPPLPGQQPDSVQLQAGDVVTMAIGETGTATTVSSITLAVVFGSRQMPNQANSPFQNPQGAPVCLFLGTTASGGGLTPAWSSNNTNGGYFAWVLSVGTIPAQSPGRKRYELMIGANVTYNDGAVQSIGHDPEVDVGMG